MMNRMRWLAVLVNACLSIGCTAASHAETSLGDLLADINPQVEDGDRRIIEPRRPWEIQCFELAARDDYCIVTQQHRLAGGDQGLSIGAMTMIRMHAGAQSMHFMLPNTVSLQKGLILRMDDSPEITVPYGYCTSDLCMAELALDDELMESFADAGILQVEATLGMPEALFSYDISVEDVGDIIASLPTTR